jgi:hypothetical protein
MKSKHTIMCSALATVFGLTVSNAGFAAQSQFINKVVAIPETSFSTPSSLNIFDTYVTEGYPPTQLTLKDGNGVCNFTESPGFFFDGPQPICSSQLLAEKSPSTKVIPFQRPFSLHFSATQIIPGPATNPPTPVFGPVGGTVFELHDTDPVFAQYGDPGTSGIRLVANGAGYAFYSNNIQIWTGAYTPKVQDSFQLDGVLQENTSTRNVGFLVLKRNGVVVVTSRGPNCNGMTPTYPPVVGPPGGSSGPAPHPLTSGPHVRLGLGKVPTPYTYQPPATTEFYIDNAGAFYYDL